MCTFVKSDNVYPGYGCCRCKHYNGLQRVDCKACGVAHCELTVPEQTTGEYREEGGVTKVKVLKVAADDKGVGYELEAVETVQASPLFGEIKPGTIIKPWVSHNAGSYAGGWQLN